MALGRSKCKSSLEEAILNLGPLDSQGLSLTKYEFRTPEYKIYKKQATLAKQQNRFGHAR